jgi:hypothetical protein
MTYSGALTSLTQPYCAIAVGATRTYSTPPIGASGQILIADQLYCCVTSIMGKMVESASTACFGSLKKAPRQAE